MRSNPSKNSTITERNGKVMFDLVLKNGTVVDSDRMYEADVYIKDGKIGAICESKEEFLAETTVDVKGKLLFPGAVDSHMHIGEYKADYEEMDTATAAAVVGGVTCLIDMPVNQQCPSIVNEDLFEEKRKHLEEKSYADFCMWGALIPENIDKLKGMHDLGAIAFKSFLSGGGADFPAPNMAKVRYALQTIAEFGGMAGFHCEDNWIIKEGTEYMTQNKLNTRQAFLDSRPLVAEILATRDIIELARETKAKVHICHVSHPEVAKMIARAKREGVDISAETCVHYLVFSKDDLIEKGCLYKCAPPLRDREASEELWKYVEDGTFSSVASDHSPGMPENRDDTKRPIYEVGNGISGVQTMFQSYFDAATKRGLSPTLLARTLAEGPAKRFGIYGKKGAIKVGFDADIVVFDQNKEWEVKAEDLYYKQKISAYVGRKGTGVPTETYLRGKLVAKDGKLVGTTGCGQFVTA